MKRIKIWYPTIFTPEEDGSAYTVVVPDMQQIHCGCVTCGDTMEEACQMALEAIGISLEETPEDKLPVPSRPETLHLEPGEFIVPVLYDSLKYKKAVATKSVKRTVSLPEWMDDLAKEEHISFSKALQRGLKMELGLGEGV